jgi:hypothetical protein
MHRRRDAEVVGQLRQAARARNESVSRWKSLRSGYCTLVMDSEGRRMNEKDVMTSPRACKSITCLRKVVGGRRMLANRHTVHMRRCKLR